MKKQDKKASRLITDFATFLARIVHDGRFMALLSLAALSAVLLYDFGGGDVAQFPLHLLIWAAALLMAYVSMGLLRHGVENIVLVFSLVTLRSARTQVKAKSTSAKELALSLTYLSHLKKQNSKVKVLLIVCAVILVAFTFRAPNVDLLNLVAITFAFVSLLSFKEVLVEYRIRKGLFGTNRTEARDLINFIIENSKDIDFTDSNGTLRRVLLPEKPSAREQAPASSADGITV